MISDFLPPHLLDELDGMGRRRRNPGPGFDISDDDQSESFGKIRPGPVIGDDPGSLVRGHHRVPPSFGLGQTPVEIEISRVEVRGVSRLVLGQRLQNRLGDPTPVSRFEPVVRIPERVYVAHRSRDRACWNLEDSGRQGRIEISSSTRLDSRVPALLDERRKPAALQIAADHNQQVGAHELENEAGLGLDEMRVLVPARDGFDGDAIAAYFARQRCQILRRRHDVHRGGGAGCEQH